MSTMPWNPGALNPSIWIDDVSDVVTDASGLAQWTNKGNLGGALVQATNGWKPQVIADGVGGRRIVRFDGADDYLNMVSTSAGNWLRKASAAWSLIVYKKRTTDVTGRAQGRALLYHPNPNGFARYVVSTGSEPPDPLNTAFFATRRDDAESSKKIIGSYSAVGEWAIRVTAMSWADNNVVDCVNGTTIAAASPFVDVAGVVSDTAAQNTRITLAANSYGAAAVDAADVDIAAVVTGVGALTTDLIRRLEGWAAHRYGLVSHLASGHPYAGGVPTMVCNELSGFAQVAGATPSAGQITHPSLSRRWSVEHGGNGRIYGNTVEYIAPEVDLDYPCRVRLVRDFDGVQIAEQWSKATGSFDFTWINPRWTYTVLAYDPVRNYRAVVADGVTPEAMPWQ